MAFDCQELKGLLTYLLTYDILCDYTLQMDRAPMKTDVTTITSGAEDVLEIVGVHEQLDRNAQRDDIAV